MKPLPPLDARQLSLLWAGPERAREIAQIHASLFDPAWDEDAVRKLLDHPAATALAAVAGEPKRTVGFVLGQVAADEAEIISLGVDPSWQRRGIGRQLVEGLVRAVRRAEGKRLHLEVAADNAAACALYRGLGFDEAGRRKGYYERHGAAAADALMLQRPV